jgi:hypothetical protein
MDLAPQKAALTDRVLDLQPGELVGVRTPAQIFATLDERGELDGMPFMPEMVQYCGRTFSVAQRADRTCAGDGMPRRMTNAVHLSNLRCEGSSHGGCQAACLMYWKEAWLERAGGNGATGQHQLTAEERSYMDDVLVPATIRAASPDKPTAYRCQATEIPRATGALWRVSDVRPNARDVKNWPLRRILRSVVIEVFNLWQAFSTRHVPRRLRIAGGRRYPFVKGALKKGEAPSGQLDLRPGELVRIKSKKEIVATLDHTNHNRGLSFDGEMANYCGRTARVRARVNHILDERTGEMIDIKSDCIILEGVVCAGDYYRFCTRAIYPYWREIWLERVPEFTPGVSLLLARTNGSPASTCPGSCSSRPDTIV